MRASELWSKMRPYVMRAIQNAGQAGVSSGSTGTVPNHEHVGSAGDGGQVDHGTAMVAASLLDDDHTQYLNATRHLAIGNGSPHHDPTTTGVGNWSAALSVSGQAWTLSQATLDARYSQVGHTHAHADLTGVDANQHVDHTAVSITAGDGLTGGGTIAANRTISLTTPGTLSATTSNGAAGNHTHAVTSVSVATAAVNLLSCDASGYLQLIRLGVGIAPAAPLHAVAAGEQLRLGSTAVDYTSFTTDATGNLSVGVTGTTVFVGGTSSPAATTDKFQVISDSLTAGVINAYRICDSVAGGALASYKARGTLAVPAVVQAGDVLGGFTGNGYTGAAFQFSGAVRLYCESVDATPDVLSYIKFETHNGSAAERARLTSEGRFGIGTGATVSAWLHVLATTEQMRLGADAANYASFTVGATGTMTLNAVGTNAQFQFNDKILLWQAPAQSYAAATDFVYMWNDGSSAAYFYSVGSATTKWSYASKVSGDTQFRFMLDANGDMEWGSGAAARDTNLYRSAANTLKTDDALIVSGVLNANTGGLRTIQSVANVSGPPTDAELDAAFGTPATLGRGFVGLVDDNDADTAMWLCVTSDASWYYAAMTKAV